MTEETRIVTKTKHPGRIAGGYRLVEWNRKNKANLTKEPINQDLQVAQEPINQDLQVATIPTTSLILGALIVVVAVGVELYFKSSSSEKSLKKKQQKIDPFNCK